MSKTALAYVDGFTPCIDAIVKEYGLVTAAVFGVIWRYCQMEDDTCWASHETIGEKIGLTRQAIGEHAAKLVKSGYLEIIESDPGSTIHYRDTGKANVSINITGGVNETDRGCKRNVQGGVNETDTKIDSLRENKENKYINTSKNFETYKYILELFAKLTGRKIPNEGTPEWYDWDKGIIAIMSEADSDLSLITPAVTNAVKTHNESGLSTSNPGSIRKTTLDLIGKLRVGVDINKQRKMQGKRTRIVTTQDDVEIEITE